LNLIDLLGVRGKAALRQLAWTPVYLLAIAPFGALASLITQSFYGSGLPPYIAMVDLPPVAGLYSFLIWPIIWVVAEELGYLGYLLPRLEALSGRTWLAAILVTFFWGLQHLANPFIPDATHLISRVLAAWVAVGGVTLVYLLGKRRLVPIIGAHYLIDLFTGFLVGILPWISR
jgi:membrane protease YdiL (CAAX protease family)